MKKAIIFVCLVTIILTSFPVMVSNAAFKGVLEKVKTHADIILMVNLDDSSSIIEKNADKKSMPASFVKITVAILILENCSNLDEPVTVSANAVRVLANTYSSVANLKPGEILSVRDLLYCLLVSSANDAATVLAEYSAGDIESFVGLMNEKVRALGCENTNFKNPHGLDDPEQYTTARDMVTIVRHALTFPLFEEITSTFRYTVPATNKSKERKLVSTVSLMNPGIKDYYYEYASGIKTGTTKGAGRCVISKASKDGYSYLIVVMNAPMLNIDSDPVLENTAFTDSKALFNWTFKNIRLRTVAEAGRVVGEVPVKLSLKTDHVQLVPEKEFAALVPIGEGAESVLVEIVPESIPEKLEAPVKKGQFIGKARVLYAEEEVALFNLVANEDIDRSFLLYLGSLIKELASTLVFRLIMLVIVLCALFFTIVLILRWNNGRKRKKPKLVSIGPKTKINKK